MEQQSLIFMGLMMLAAGGLFYVFVYPYLSGQVAAEKRRSQFQGTSSTKSKRGDRQVDPTKRRQQILESVRELETESRKKTNTLASKLLQAGMTVEVKNFYLISAGVGVGVAFFGFVSYGDPLIALGAGVVAGLGLPRWFVNFRIKRRFKKFLSEFPGAVDIIIRGVKAGLPLTQCVAIIAAESPEPVRSEFRRILEAQSIGLSIGESCDRMAESMPVAEANFFSIVVNLQQKSGGNLSEALGNLSRVLRDRKKMRLKVNAMSAEAKASAGIIGALPFLVCGLVYLSSPEYLSLLFTTMTGRIVLVASGCWMVIGIAVMRKMIQFDF
ncbi:MAG: type II secretion system F family protein [Hyphomicrobiales bacterium]|nr:type II secretion system F family protein [Rhodoblastus sp.]MCB9997983.1 type II secretion system F family protein [Methylobacteriaceae bacterium]MCC2103931.1 type II secretion system F family protein [Hyphomicrobiales bacterium]HRY01927.1 type II secretion system F family protein [Beijerinckiaceae bacterium]MCB1523975.1 type II secretion system F family protein [Rhodoblastus sp.]